MNANRLTPICVVSQDIGDRSGVLAWAAVTAVAGADDEDVLEASSSVDHVVDLVEHEDAVAGQFLDDGVVGQVCG